MNKRFSVRGSSDTIYNMGMVFIFVGFIFTVMGLVLSGISEENKKQKLLDTESNIQIILETARVYQIEAVQRGFAEWKVSSDGTTEFHWKESQKELPDVE
jgi:uncharacterized membrane protein